MRERRSTFHNRFRRRFSAGDRFALWTGGAYTHNAAGCVTRIEQRDIQTSFAELKEML
jgi:hypothetical protein